MVNYQIILIKKKSMIGETWMHANLNKSMSPIFPIQKGFQQLYKLSIEHKTHTYTSTQHSILIIFYAE